MKAKLDDSGREIPDGKSLRMPSGMERPETLAEQVRRLVRTEWSRQAAEQGFETFEESEDFDVDDDFEPSTPYETFFDPMLGRELTPQQIQEHEEYYKREYVRAQQRYFEARDQAAILEGKRPSASAERRLDDDGQPAQPASARDPSAPAKED